MTIVMMSVGLYLLLVTSQLILPSVSYPDEFNDDGQQSSDDALSKFWGIADTDTFVGKLFQCKIPPERDAFKGTIVEYDVEGEEPNTLPKWLIFDKKRSMLEGVATIEDIGDTRINVKAYDSKGKFVSDMFVIEVYPLENDNTNTKKKCRDGEEVMMLAIIIDKDLHDVTPDQKILVMKTLARTLSIPPSTILFLPQLSSDYSLNFVEADEKSYERNANSSILTWQVGCDDRIWAEQLEVVSSVKKLLQDNVLADLLHLPLADWRLISNSNSFRMRRHVNSTVLDEDADNNEDDDQEGGDEDDEEINPSRSSSLQNSFSSITVKNDSLPLQQSYLEENSTSLPSSNTTNALRSHPVLNGDDEDEAETDSPNVYGSIFESGKESVSLGPNPDLEAIPCAVCSTTEGSRQTEEPSVIPTVARFPPKVGKTLNPFVVKAGQLYREKILEDSFVDENGHGITSNLSLRLLPETDICHTETVGIELEPQTQTLLMLASPKAVSKYEFALEATNSANMSTNTSVSISVQDRREERNFNFEISFHLRRKSQDQRMTVKFQQELLDTIARLYGDVNTDNIILRNFSCNPLVLTWTNATLSLDTCDGETIRKLLSALVEAEGSVNTNARARQYFDSLIQVEKITWVGKGVCEDGLPKPNLNVSSKKDNPPGIRERIGGITARVGELLVYQIPENAFHDIDGYTIRENKMGLTLSGQNTLPSDSWLQFDEKNQEIYGVPMMSDIGSTAYTLTCYDDQGTKDREKAARQTIEVKVEPAPTKIYSVEFSMTLNSSYVSYDEFNRTPMLRRIFIKKLSELFDDKDTSSIVISGYAPGSLIVIWHNKTLPLDTCPEEEIEGLRRVILTNKGELAERVNKVLGPEFQALSAMLSPIGVCEGGLSRIHVTEIPLHTTSLGMEILFSKANFEYYLREYFVEVIMPIIIIILMVMLAGTVACLLYRRQRRTKWNLNDETERRTYRNRGIPVIFQDELEERLETSNKNPIIMKEEKPPLPPPEYQRTLPMATTALLSDFDDPSYHQEGSSYSPQAPERNGRDKSSTPTYRKPPPYIPP